MGSVPIVMAKRPRRYDGCLCLWEEAEKTVDLQHQLGLQSDWTLL